MKMLSWIFVAFTALAVSACGTTQQNSQTAAQGQSLIGDWNGTWTADNGSSGEFALKVIRVSKGGRIIARRSSPTEKEASVEHVTMGKITGDQIELDRGKGKNSWIKLSMQKADDGQLWLKGRYSATAGKKGSKKVVQGSISIKKAN
ncbi:MAG: hypothetical protein QF521_07835 [Alphaproteobacteria bacterium]|jgi:hypothetical protein|nr:hypothetical protein [Alphaproteobacteria bacterium]